MDMEQMVEVNEFDFRDDLRKRRLEIGTFEELTAFLKHVEENGNCGYAAAPRAMAQASLAVAYYLCDKFGITGFQAGCVMWDFVREWMYKSNKTGLKIIDFDDMLYPQYQYKYEKTIPDYVWEAMQKEAASRMAEREGVHPDVYAHWKSIVDGNVPFGYVVKNN
jgi:hypothetical protein